MMGSGYADKGHIVAVEFDRKIIIYWWLMANFGLLSTIVGIILIPIWILFGLIVHKKQYDNMSGALTDRSINMRTVSYTHLRAHETREDRVFRDRVEKKK